MGESVEAATSKRCPACAESVSAEAVVCRHCGYDFSTGSRPTTSAQGENRLAIAAFVLGILWVFWLGSILAVIFGHVALSQIKSSSGAQSPLRRRVDARRRGRGLAIAGLVLGYVGLATALLLFVLAVSYSPGFNIDLCQGEPPIGPCP